MRQLFLAVALAAVMMSGRAAAAAAAAGGPEGAKVPFETVLKQSDGGPRKAAEVVIRSEREWERFIETCSSEATRNKLRGRKLNFGKETVIAVAVGRNASILGSPDYEKQAGVQAVRAAGGGGGGGLIVEYADVFSDHLDPRARYPLHVVRVARAKGGVWFRKSRKAFGG